MLKEKHSPSALDSLTDSGINSASPGHGIWAVFLSIFLIGAFYFGTIRAGQDWGDDFAMYIRHAMNLADGAPYNQTGHIRNPKTMIGPLAYPPVFPLLLAPVYKIWGLNLTAMKAEVIFFFLLSLWMIYLALRNELEQPYLIAILVLIGFNPWVWEFKDHIVSDIPYIFFTYLSLFLIRKAYETDLAARGQFRYGLLTGVSIYLSYGARTIGVAMLLALIGYDLLRKRRPSLYMISTAILAFACFYLQKIAMRSDAAAGYADHIIAEDDSIFLRLRMMTYHGWVLLQSFNEYWNNGYSKLFRWGAVAFILGAAGAGYLIKIRKISKITIFEIFILVYLAPIIMLPIGIEKRYLLPILPLILFYTFIGIQAILRRYRKKSLALTAITGIFLATYFGQYSKLDLKSLHEGIGKTESQQLFEYVKHETTEKDILLFRKPRALHLFTGRTGATWHVESDDEKLWEYFRQIHATYLITGPAEVEPWDQEFIRRFAERNHRRMQETFTNADFHVYRLNLGTNDSQR